MLGIPNATQKGVAFFNQENVVGKVVGDVVGNAVGNVTHACVGDLTHMLENFRACAGGNGWGNFLRIRKFFCGSGKGGDVLVPPFLILLNTNIGFEARKTLTKAARDDALNVGGKDVNTIIPLNRWSFFEELNDKMLVPMQLQFNIELNSDDEMVHKAQAADPARVVINRFILWVPRLTPRDSMYDKFVSSFLKETQWKYLREMYNVSAPTNTSGFFQISSSIDNVKHIFVYLKNSYRDANDHRQAEMSPFTMNTFSLPGGSSLSNCRLEYGNGIFYPETEYDSESKVRIFNDVMAYAMRKNDYNTGTQLNTANYNSLYPLIYFDLTYQSEKVTRDPKQLIFRYRLSANTNQNFAVHAVVIHEEILKIDKIGNELVIV